MHRSNDDSTMKIYIIIAIILLLFIPVIPYENEITEGITIVENRSVAEWIWENYQLTEEITDVEDQSDKTL